MDDDSFDFSEIDDDIAEPDFILAENLDILDGIFPLDNSDFEQENELDLQNKLENEVIDIIPTDINDTPNNTSEINDNLENNNLTIKCKQRVANPLMWKRNLNKAKRARGEVNVSERGKYFKNE